jgi:hypothetical protein
MMLRMPKLPDHLDARDFRKFSILGCWLLRFASPVTFATVPVLST